MRNHLLSLVLIVLGLVAFLVLWLLGVKFLGALLVGLAVVLVGLILYRRGR